MEGEAEILAVLHTVFVTLPVRETDMVELTEEDVHPDTVPVEQTLGVVVTERVLVWHTLSEGVFVEDGEKDEVKVPDPQALMDPLEVKECETDTVGESVEVNELDVETLLVPLNVGLELSEAEMLVVVHTVIVTLLVLETEIVGLTEAEVQPETVLVELMLGVFVTVTVPDWDTLSEGVFVADGDKERVKVPDPQALVVLVNAKEYEPELVEVASGETLVKLLRVEE